MEGMAGAEVVGRGNSIFVKHGDDKGLLARFYFNKIYQKDYIKINVPGDSKTEWDRPAKPQDQQRFPTQWAQYKASQSQFGGQTTLEAWEALSETQITQFKSFNVFTVEHLASMQDGLIQNMGPGIRDIVNRAKAWLEEQKAKHNEQVLLSEINKRDSLIENLQRQMEALQEQVGAMAQDQPKTVRRGRKPKEIQNDSTE